MPLGNALWWQHALMSPTISYSQGLRSHYGFAKEGECRADSVRKLTLPHLQSTVLMEPGIISFLKFKTKCDADFCFTGRYWLACHIYIFSHLWIWVINTQRFHSTPCCPKSRYFIARNATKFFSSKEAVFYKYVGKSNFTFMVISGIWQCEASGTAI